MLPLTGVNVVSLAINLPGPAACARLAEFGAAVTKVEPPGGDPLARAAAGWYAELAGRQTVLTLDLKAAADRATLDELLTGADLLITSMRPTALQRLGLAAPHEQFPRLSLIEIVGHDGDLADEPGHDLNYQAAQGTLTPPHMPRVPLAALQARDRSGGGAVFRVALADAAAWAGGAVRHGLMGDNAILGGAFPGYGIYECADGHVALGALESHFFVRTLEIFGADGTHESLRTAFSGKTIAQLEAIAAEADIPLNGVK
ncbi:CoA transferase [Mycobacteroides abscessus]|uniref:CoA transferase n=1 Tax=Mycobacteroides abscessus TaxID=36809 RepID=UPI000C268457|nr:CoA transferase [Mycobacteroides abscessus]MBE5461968.1 hypothetical protein [Mycobacteroides abscessus]QOF42749.1 hypothetical protein E3G69_001789 [Mycobacteroides abscessus]QOF47447.1 hypothetical protein E3G70_001787 [Mycobacteroides abscessus]